MKFPLLQSLVLSGFVSRRLALAHRNTSLRQACLVHWIALTASYPVGMALLLADTVTGPDLSQALQREGYAGPSTIMVAVAIVLSVEIGFVLLAVLLMPWGDARAPLRLLWRHALRTSWLHTGHLGLAAGPRL